VVKHYAATESQGHDDPFAHELASCQLFTAMAGEKHGPELIAHDNKLRLLVLEDLGRSSTLADRLLGNDARAAERALLGWARALGRLHTSTAGREADFTALMRRLGVPSWQDPVVPNVTTALAELPDLLQDVLGVRTVAAFLEQARSAARLLGGTKYRAFSTSDVCPDNYVVTNRGGRFLDFEWGCVRDVCLDAAALRVPFPSCWCAFALPPGMTEAMLAAWRSEVATMWNDLDDDEVLLPRLLAAQLLWVCVSTCWLLPRVAKDDLPIAAHLPSPRGSVALASRWQRLRVDAVAAGLDGVAADAEAVVTALAARFGSDVLDLPLYPAFR
jgi:hypothetical protein